MDDTKGAPVRQGGESGSGPTLLRPCPKHMSATERLRKVIQELVDTEKSYVKVRAPSIYYYKLTGLMWLNLINEISCTYILFFTPQL